MLKSQDNLPQRVADWLSSRGRKNSTCRAHKLTIKRLLSKGLSPLTPEKFNIFIFKEKERGISSSHINAYISTMRVWVQYCEGNNIRHTFKINDLKMHQDKFKMKATMSDDEIEALLSIEPKVWYRKHSVTGKKHKVIANQKNHIQWTVFFSIMAYTGMRPGEVANLTIDNIDFGRKTIIVEDSKTNTPRLVPLAPNIEKLLHDYVKGCKKHLFPSKNGVVKNVDWHYNFHERIKRLGIKRTNLTPYSLRHSLITRLLEEDVNIFKVQKIVGHSDLRTTAHYTHLTTKDTQLAVQKHPLIRKHTSPHAIINSVNEYIKSLEIEKDDRFEFNQNSKNNEFTFSIKITAQD